MANTKAAARRQKKNEEREAKRKLIAKRKRINMASGKLPKSYLRTCDDFYAIALNSAKQGIEITIHAHCALAELKTKVTASSEINREQHDKLITKIDNVAAFVRILNAIAKALLPKLGAVADADSAQERMRIVTGVLPAVQKSFSICTVLNTKICELEKAVTAFCDGKLTDEDLDKIDIPDVKQVMAVGDTVASVSSLLNEAMLTVTGLSSQFDEVEDDDVIFGSTEDTTSSENTESTKDGSEEMSTSSAENVQSEN